MQITDTIADMLTRIRNANSAKHASVDIPASNMKKQIAQSLLDEGYIKSFKVIDDNNQGSGNHRSAPRFQARSENLLKLQGYAEGNEGSGYRNRIHL